GEGCGEGGRVGSRAGPGWGGAVGGRERSESHSRSRRSRCTRTVPCRRKVFPATGPRSGKGGVGSGGRELAAARGGRWICRSISWRYRRERGSTFASPVQRRAGCGWGEGGGRRPAGGSPPPARRIKTARRQAPPPPGEDQHQ